MAGLFEVVRCCLACSRDGRFVRFVSENALGFGHMLWLSGKHFGSGNALEFGSMNPLERRRESCREAPING